MSPLHGRICLVTGAASGIGEAASIALAAAGGTVIVTDVDLQAATRVAAQIRDNGGMADAQRLDVASESEWSVLLAWATERFGRVDVLVNNAGVAGDFALVEMPLTEWRRVFAINCDGAFLGMKHCIPHMPAGGSIINVSSIYGKVGGPRHIAYSASKGAVTLMSKSAALECANEGRGIRVNSLHPGYVETPLFATLDDARKTRYRDMHPIGRVGQPEEIARAVLFLASDDSSFMTGAELVVDGGFTAR